MKFTKLVPQIFYKDINVGLRTFVECLEFVVGHNELEAATPFCVIKKDHLSIYLFQDTVYSEIEHSEYRLETDDIETVYKKVAEKFPELLHPNLSEVTLRPWGAKEFAMLDGQIGIRIQQW